MRNGTPSATMGGEEIPLRIPGPFALRLDLYTAVSRNIRRATGACLGLSWGGPPLATKCRDFSDSGLLEYGGRVIDELIGQYSWPEIRDGGTTAWTLIAESVAPMLEEPGLPTPGEVETAENFTAPAADGTR